MNQINLSRSEKSVREFGIKSEMALAMLQLIDPSIETHLLTQRVFDQKFAKIYDVSQEFTMEEFNEKFVMVQNGDYPIESFLHEVSIRSYMRTAILANRIFSQREFEELQPFDLLTSTNQELLLTTLKYLQEPKSLDNPYKSITRTATVRIEARARDGEIITMSDEQAEVLSDQDLIEMFDNVMQGKLDDYEGNIFKKMRLTLREIPEEVRLKKFLLLAKKGLQNKPWKEIAKELEYSSGKSASDLFYNLRERINKRF